MHSIHQNGGLSIMPNYISRHSKNVALLKQSKEQEQDSHPAILDRPKSPQIKFSKAQNAIKVGIR